MKGRALFERNANACESAKHPTCVCACRGALHGSRHSAAWRNETWATLEEAARELHERGAAELEAVALELTQTARAKPRVFGRRHHCAAFGCHKSIPWNWLMCQRHWDKVPHELQEKVYEFFEPGRTSREYLAAARRAIASLQLEQTELAL